jgi:hypothetical protein
MTTKTGNIPKSLKDPELVEEDSTQDQINLLETRITQLETALKNTITFETLAARLISTKELCTKKVRKPRTKRVLTHEEKAAFHARMMAGRLAKEKSRKDASEK